MSIEAEAEPVQTDDGWIEWKGGECPVAPGTLVEGRLRDGDIGVGLARQWSWDHGGGTADLVAYHIIKPAEPTLTAAQETPDAG